VLFLLSQGRAAGGQRALIVRMARVAALHSGRVAYATPDNPNRLRFTYMHV
jgi:hypothetical protein